jgi:hypothetical protein
MTNIAKPHRRTLTADAVYYLALARVNPRHQEAVEQWLFLFPVTGLVSGAAAWLARLLDRGIIDLVNAVIDLVTAIWACGWAFSGYQWRRVWPLRCPEMARVWGLAALVAIETALWVIQPRPALV